MTWLVSTDYHWDCDKNILTYDHDPDNERRKVEELEMIYMVYTQLLVVARDRETSSEKLKISSRSCKWGFNSE